MTEACLCDDKLETPVVENAGELHGPQPIVWIQVPVATESQKMKTCRPTVRRAFLLWFGFMCCPVRYATISEPC